MMFVFWDEAIKGQAGVGAPTSIREESYELPSDEAPFMEREEDLPLFLFYFKTPRQTTSFCLEVLKNN